MQCTCMHGYSSIILCIYKIFMLATVQKTCMAVHIFLQVNGSCPTRDPTVVLLYFSCGSYSPDVLPLPVHITASGNTTEVIQSDPVEAGHRNCIVKVVSKNLSGKTVNDSHTFGELCREQCQVSITKQYLCTLIDTTDVQVFKAQPLNGTNNLGAINCSLTVAINSSVLEFMVDITGSSGRRFDGIPLSRKSNQRVVSNETMMLPVDIYTLSLSMLTSVGFQYANFTETVTISRSNYSASTTTTTTATTAVASTSKSPAPTPASGRLGELGECLLNAACYIHAHKRTLVMRKSLLYVHDLHTCMVMNDNVFILFFLHIYFTGSGEIAGIVLAG